LQRTASIADVAARAGVSPTTVSHVISGNRPVSARTAAVVRRAMAELDYVPNHAARSLRSGSTRMLGLLVPDIGNPYFADLARGAEDGAQANGYRLVLGNTGFDAARELEYLQALRAGHVDGIVYATGGMPPSDQLVEVIDRFLVVLADEEVPGLAVDTIISDGERGGRLAGEHLRDLGHREILAIDGPPGLASSADRARGFDAVFAGGAGDVTHVRGDYVRDAAADAVRAALRRGETFTAVFAANDLMAVGALDALAHAGLAAPDDVSLVSFDDTSLATLVRPALTAVRQPVRAIGRAAAEHLITAIDHPAGRPPERIVLDVELVVRDSTAPPGGPATA